MRFNAIIPKHDVHLQCFYEVAESVVWALRELGHDAMLNSSEEVPGDLLPPPRHIYFGLPRWPIPAGSILYNGEQVSSQSLWRVRNLPEIYKHHTVWDYSAANARRYGSSAGLVEPPVVRPGFCPLLVGRIPILADQHTHDVVFFGSMNARRDRVLTEMEEMGIRVLRMPLGLYGRERDAQLALAPLCVNIHYYDDAIFEAVRCSYLTHGGMCVLTETSPAREEQTWGIAAFGEFGKLADLADKMLRQPKFLGELQQSQFASLQKVSIVDDVGTALERLASSDVRRVQASVLLPEQLGMGTGAINATVDGAPEQANYEWKWMHAAPELTLCMIVKNEASIIERCLASVKPYLKRYSIVDTGSTDGTPDIIRKFMGDVPGQVHERPWKEFDGSRNEAIDLARRECNEQGWLLQIDSDEVLLVDEQIWLPEGFDCYNAWVSRCPGCARWGRPTFLRANKPWFYEMPRHEGLYCRSDAPTAPQPAPGVLVLSLPDGARAKESEYDRYLRDAKVLEQWIIHHPGHTRAQYYIAQSYRDAATGKQPIDRAAMQQAVTNYLKRANMPGGFDQETFSAWFEAAKAMAHCGYPWAQVQQAWLTAYNLRPSRVEPLYLIARHYREEGSFALAEVFGRHGVKIQMTDDHFIGVEPTYYSWVMKEELAVSLTWLGKHEEALLLMQEVLPLVPDHERPRIQENIEMCCRVLGLIPG